MIPPVVSFLGLLDFVLVDAPADFWLLFFAALPSFLA
jgi:hypothetical protein